MDSLTQIVLGAACGEAVLGKKIGNRALLFGAIGGTIPDLDVIVGNILYSNQIDAMLFHRGFMHSILFSIIGAFLFGWITYKLYNSGKRKGTTIPKDWVLLFYWSLFTHPLLDAFTPYGTQLFAPFSSFRVAINNISVADPFYTLPFLICLVVVMFFKRSDKQRIKWLRLGIGISSFYMLLTLVNKVYVATVFESTLQKKGIVSDRFSIQPSLLNNFLWYGITETESNYQVGYYSLFDTKKEFSDWQIIPKKQDISKDQNAQIASLAWFSNDYYNIERVDEITYNYTDLRYPILQKDGKNEAVFFFELYYAPDGRFDMKPFDPENSDFGYVFQSIWDRLKGK
ncbi:MAG: metal-dependent hydrolase [bacterium]